MRLHPTGNLRSYLGYPDDAIGAEFWVCGVCGDTDETCPGEEHERYLFQFGKSWLLDQIHGPVPGSPNCGCGIVGEHEPDEFCRREA